MLSICRNYPLNHRCFPLMDHCMMANFLSSDILHALDHKTLLFFCPRMKQKSRICIFLLYMFLVQFYNLMNLGHCMQSLNINYWWCAVLTFTDNPYLYDRSLLTLSILLTLFSPSDVIFPTNMDAIKQSNIFCCISMSLVNDSVTLYVIYIVAVRCTTFCLTI